jgi:thioredoxin reductase
MTDKNLPVAIIGAGPVGLAAAARLIARGETPLLLEAGGSIGHNVLEWHHVPMFTTWDLNTDGAAVDLLTASGWRHPPKGENPTGGELVERYLAPLAALPALRPYIRLNARVVAVTRKGFDKVRTKGRTGRPFVLRVETPDGETQLVEAKAVIDASGTWNSPNPAGADGLPAVGEKDAADRIFYGIPDVLGRLRERYAGKTTIVVGGGHSALNALIELAELKERAPATRIIWIMRKDNVESALGGEIADALPARGALGVQARALVESGAVNVVTPFRIARITREPDGRIAVDEDHGGKERQFVADELVVATGFRPDFSALREIRLSLDPWLESSGEIGPLIDPNLHSCGTVRPHGAKELAHAEPGFYIAGMKSYGRAPTFLVTTGYEQVRSIVAALTGDTDAAARVELKLPETGVCVGRPSRSRAPDIAARAGAASRCGVEKVPALEAVEAGTCSLAVATVATKATGC